MKKLLKNTLLFVIIVAVFDYILGTGFTFMRDHAGCGTFQELKYAAEECDDDVLIFGSSRALHHYDPKVISDSLNLSCHNFGHEGMCVLYSYGLLQLISSHHVPKIIICDYCRFDSKKEDPLTYLADLRPYYDNPRIKSFFQDVVPLEKVKNLSLLYRFNSKSLQLFNGMMNKKKITNGFQPLKGHIKKYKETVYGSDVDSVKYKYMTRMIEWCQENDVQLIFFISPFYNGLNHTFPSEYKKLFDQYGIWFYT